MMMMMIRMRMEVKAKVAKKSALKNNRGKLSAHLPKRINRVKLAQKLPLKTKLRDKTRV